MSATISADKSREELRLWHQTDPDGLVDYAFDLQTELRQLRDAAAQNSRNSSRPPSTDRSEKPTPQSLRKKSGRKTGGQPGHPGRTLQPSRTPTHVELHRCLECSCGDQGVPLLPPNLDGALSRRRQRSRPIREKLPRAAGLPLRRPGRSQPADP